MARRVFTVTKGGSNTPEYRLRRAAESGDVAQVRELLRGSLDINAADPEKRTALHLSAEAGHLEVVEALLAAGAQVDPKAAGGETPLLVATAEGHAEVVRALVRAGANLLARDRYGNPPLNVAVERCRDEVIAALLSAGAPVDAPGSDRQTALFYAATRSTGLVRTLLAAGARVDARTPDGDTPLHSAAQIGYRDICEVLLSVGARVDPINAEGMTPLALAAGAGFIEVVDLLLRSGANIDGSPLARASPLTLAERRRHALVAELLAERGGTRRKQPPRELRRPVRPAGTGREPLYSAASPWLDGSTLEFDLTPNQAPTLGNCTADFIQACLTALGFSHAPESWSIQPIRTPYYSPGGSRATPNDLYAPAWILRVRLVGPPLELDNLLEGFPAEVNQLDTTSDYQATHRLLLDREQGVTFVAVGSFSGEVPPTLLSRIEQRLRELGVRATLHVRSYENARFQLRARLEGLDFPQGAEPTKAVLSLMEAEGGITHWQHEALLTPR
jgi:ankyrin repeat protein